MICPDYRHKILVDIPTTQNIIHIHTTRITIIHIDYLKDFFKKDSHMIILKPFQKEMPKKFEADQEAVFSMAFLTKVMIRTKKKSSFLD